MSVMLNGAETWTLLVADMKTLRAFHMRCQQQILDIRWWAHVSNAEVLQWSGLSTIGDILRHRRLSLFGHVARQDPGVPAYDALRLTVDTYEGRKPMASWRRPSGRPRNVWLNKVQEDANALPLSTLWRSEITRGHGVARRSTRTTPQWWRWWLSNFSPVNSSLPFVWTPLSYSYLEFICLVICHYFWQYVWLENTNCKKSTLLSKIVGQKKLLGFPPITANLWLIIPG